MLTGLFLFASLGKSARFHLWSGVCPFLYVRVHVCVCACVRACVCVCVVFHDHDLLFQDQTFEM